MFEVIIYAHSPNGIAHGMMKIWTSSTWNESKIVVVTNLHRHTLAIDRKKCKIIWSYGSAKQIQYLLDF